MKFLENHKINLHIYIFTDNLQVIIKMDFWRFWATENGPGTQFISKR